MWNLSQEKALFWKELTIYYSLMLVLWTSCARAWHELVNSSSCLARAQLMQWIFKKTAPPFFRSPPFILPSSTALAPDSAVCPDWQRVLLHIQIQVLLEPGGKWKFPYQNLTKFVMRLTLRSMLLSRISSRTALMFWKSPVEMFRLQSSGVNR